MGASESNPRSKEKHQITASESKPPLNEMHCRLTDDSLNVLFLRNLDITSFLEICIERKTTKQWENVLLNFWEKFDSVSKHGRICEFDIACLFVLDYVYYNLSASVSTISRCLFAYQNRNILLDDRQTSLCHTRKYIFSEQLRLFTNLYDYRKCEEMLLDLTFSSILDGNRGIALFLVKFGLVKFPYIVKGKGVKISKTHLMHGLSGFPDNVKTAIHLDELVDLMNNSDISLRSILILFYIIVFAEYEMHERYGTIEQYIEKMDYQNLMCLDLFIMSRTETDIIFRDIETFIEMFLKPLVNDEYCRSLMETAWIMYQKKYVSHNPRSLKCLARCTIRETLQRHTSLPGQVNQLKIPESLKEFLLFHRENIWKYFKRYLVNHKLQNSIIDISFLLERMFLQEL